MLLFNNRNYTILWLAYTISLIGDYAVLVALPFFIYQLTGSTIATGTMFALAVLPGIIFGSIGGVMADSYNKKHIMIYSDILRAILLLSLLLVVSISQIWIVYIFAFLDSILAQFFFPARTALLLQTVSKDDLVAMNSTDTTTNSIIGLIGPVISGGLMTIFGVMGIIIANSVSFLLSALILCFLKYIQKEPSSADSPTKSVIKLWKEGFLFIRRNKVINLLFSISMLVMIAQGFLNVLMILFVTKIIFKDSIHWGWMITAQATGGIIGGLVIGRLKNVVTPVYMMVSGLLGSALTFWVIIHMQSFTMIFALSIILGVMAIVYFVGIQTTLQGAIDQDYRGRIFGFLKVARSIAVLIGIVIATLLEPYIGVLPLLNSVSILYCVAGVVSLIFVQSRTKAINTPTHL